MQNYLENNENVLVGERIRAIREGFHMSREKFSEMIDISEVFLGQIERGERSLSIKTLKKIVIYTGVSSDYILFGNSENNEYTSKINRILNKCSESTLKYIYELIHSSFSFFKKITSRSVAFFIPRPSSPQIPFRPPRQALRSTQSCYLRGSLK